MSIPRTGTPCACGDHWFAPATKGYVFLVSPEDAHLLQLKWSANIRGRQVRLHHCTPQRKFLILSREACRPVPSADQIVDHRSGDTLDNRRENLRPCTHTENAWNRAKPKGKSLPKGVVRHRDKFRATIKVYGTHYDLGSYSTPEAASEAYQAAAQRFHGEFVRAA